MKMPDVSELGAVSIDGRRFFVWMVADDWDPSTDAAVSDTKRCIWEPCVATWRHWHGGFPAGYDNPDDPTGPPIPFEGDDPEPNAVRDYNGGAFIEESLR